MKKFFIILLSVICMGCLAAAIGCTDPTADSSSSSDSTADQSSVSDSSGSTDYVEGPYDLVFSYYQYDENGDIVTDSDGSTYVVVYVTYTAVESDAQNAILVDVENGDTVEEGDVITFTVSKSIFCEYTDTHSYPVAYVNDEVIDYNADTGIYTLTVAGDMATSSGDLIIWVGNVEMMAETITGTGTESNPYTINTVADWIYFATYINEDFYTTMNAAYWALGRDLDFEGEEVYIVGDGYTSTSAYFMGSFDGQGYTLSNFVIDNEISSGNYYNYVGVFGICSAYSGISAVIQNLNVENFTIKATAPSAGACVVGGIVGYGMGFNLINCSVTDCTITITGNDSYYSYGGGLVGIIQSYYDEDNNVAYYSSIQYAAADNVDITCTGVIYMAGGLAAYVTPYAESAPVYVTNSYANNITVSGAIRTGGIAGTIARYSSVQNCYATGSVSSNATTTSVYDDYKGTQLDDTIAYAGGIAGYAENDTVIAGCFFVGTMSASASLGTKYTGYLYGGCAAAGYETYYSSAVITLDNLHDNNTQITSSAVTKSALEAVGWHEEDWTFGSGYPTINSETVSYSFDIIINIDGATYETVKASSYLPMAYRYLLYDYGSDGGISIYIRDENNGSLRTYGYFFDEACENRIPTGYVITSGMTIYAKFADCSEFVSTDTVTKEYYVTGNGSTATVIFYANGVYSYEEGAVYLTGTYEYDGSIITFKDGYFSRLANITVTSGTSTVTVSDNQRASYYTFYAIINGDGNLEIFDCSTIYIDTYSSDYDYLARFYPEGDPLVAVSADNITFAGKYLGSDGYTYSLDVDYTGTAVSGSTSRTLTYYVDSDGSVIVMVGSTPWLAKLSGDKIVSLTYYLNGVLNENMVVNMTAYDDFEGTWVVSGIVERTYTFDGLGNWEYVDASTEDSGTYTVTNGVLTFTHNGNVMTAALNDDGTVNVEKADTDYDITLYSENSITGTWYTYSLSVRRYTLNLYGINPDGWGEAEFEGTTGFRYTIYSATSATVVYDIYYGDSLYAYLNYDVKTGILDGYFYDSDTEAYDTNYTFYIYDDFYGTWVGSSADFASVTFNGFGLYNVAYAGTGTRAVKGTVTVTNTAGTTTSGVTYIVDMSTGEASFTYGEVEYTLTYDAFTNTIKMVYAGGTIALEKEDEFADVVFETKGGTTYSFDGRGYLDGGGVVTITVSGTESTAAYSIDVNGVITITDGSSSYTIYCGNDGYQLNDGTALYIQNSFTGTWAIYGWYTQITIGDIRYIYNGTDIEISAVYDGKDITLYYDGELMWFTQTSTASGSVTYYITPLAYGLAISTEKTYTDDDDFAYMSAPDTVYGTWTAKDGAALAIDGTANSAYTYYGEVTYTSADGKTTYTGVYYYEDGQYVVYYNSTYYYYTLESSASTYAYTDGTSYLVEVTDTSSAG